MFFISGTGTNLKALIQNSRRYNFPITIKLIISNKKEAKGINLAKRFSIPFIIISTKKSNYENQLIKILNDKGISIICLAGYMKILSKKFINNFRGKIINIHPSLLPKYKGTNTFAKILKNKEKKAGCTVHYVNEKLDSGKIILKKSFEISKNEDINSLKKKTQKMEHLAFSEAITRIFMQY